MWHLYGYVAIKSTRPLNGEGMNEYGTHKHAQEGAIYILSNVHYGPTSPFFSHFNQPLTIPTLWHLCAWHKKILTYEWYSDV